MNRTLGIVIKGRDEASAIFGKVNRSLANLGRTAGSIKGLVLGALGGYLGGTAIKNALTAFSESEKVQAKLAGTLKATGNAAGFTAQQLMEYASDLQKATTFDDEAITNAQAILATFKDIRGDTFRQATEAMLDMSTVLDQDLKASAIQLGKALNDPVQGVTALRRVGVSLTEDQMKQIKGFAAVNDKASAQAVILRELQSEFGGVARATGQTAAGAMARFHNAAADVNESIGKALSPAVLYLAEVFENSMPFIAELASWAGDHIANAFAAMSVATRDWGRTCEMVFKSYRILWDDFVREQTGSKGSVLEKTKDWWNYQRDQLLTWATGMFGVGAAYATFPMPGKFRDETVAYAYDRMYRQQVMVAKSYLERGDIQKARDTFTDQLRQATQFLDLTEPFWNAVKRKRDQLKPPIRPETPAFNQTWADTESISETISKTVNRTLARNELYQSRFMTRAPGQSPDRFTVKVAPDPRLKELVDQSKTTNRLLGRMVEIGKTKESLAIEVFDPP